MSTEPRFNGSDIIFPKWLRELGFIDSNKAESGSAGVAIRLLPNKKLLVIRVHRANVLQRPKGAARFELELSDDSSRVPLGGGWVGVMRAKIARAIRNNQTVETTTVLHQTVETTTVLRPQMRVYNEANGAGTVEQIVELADEKLCCVRWDLTQRATWESERSCDPDLSDPNQSGAA